MAIGALRHAIVLQDFGHVRVIYGRRPIALPSSRLSFSMQSFQVFLKNYPIVFFLAILTASFIYSSLAGPWAKLARSYRYSLPFGGQTWKWRGVILGKNGRTNSQPMTIGASEVGLYLRPDLPFIQLPTPILIPWADLSVEKDQRWTETVYCIHSASHPQIKITISDISFSKIAAIAENKLSSIQTLGIPPRREPSTTSQIQPTLQKKLIAKIFAVTFAIGLSFGLINHGIARLQALLYPVQYQIYFPGQYQSLEYGEEWPEAFVEFLGLSESIYVKVERNKAEIVSETYYSVFGSMTTSRYVASKWTSTGSGGILASPIYMANCVIPLAGGWLTIMGVVATWRYKSITSQNSRSLQRVKRIFTLAIHSSAMGFVNFICCYWVASIIRLCIRVVSGGSL
jgi:hypothetical protein